MQKEKQENRFESASIWTKIALVLIPSVLLITLIEGGTRLLVWKFYGAHDAGMHWAFEYEPYLLTRVSEIPKEFAPKEDRYRILLLGGSTAQQMPNGILENAFKSLTSRNVEVINFGQGGYIINQERIMLLLHGVRSKPDLIVSLNAMNDIVSSTKVGEPGITYSNSYIAFSVDHPFLNGIASIFKKSQFFNSINKLRERKIERAAQVDAELESKTMAHIEEGLNSIAIIANGMDVPYVAVLQPYIHLRQNPPEVEENLASNYEYRRDFMADFIRALNARLEQFDFPGSTYYVDGTKAFDDTESQCFIDEVHLSTEGKMLLANFIVGEIQRANFEIPLDF